MNLVNCISGVSNFLKVNVGPPSQLLIKQIDSSDSVHTIGSAISNLLSLTQDGPQLCSIIAKVTAGPMRAETMANAAVAGSHFHLFGLF